MRQEAPAPSSYLGDRPLARLLASAWARLKTLRAGLARDAVFAGVPDDRFQARLSVYQWVSRYAADRRILDLNAEGGYGAEALVAAGASEVLGVVADSSWQRYSENTYSTLGVSLLAAPAYAATRGDDFDLLLAVAGEENEHLPRLLQGKMPTARGSRVVLARGDYAASAASWFGPECERLGAAFLRCRRYLHLPPPAYRPDWRSRAPARARAPEYRFLELTPELESRDAEDAADTDAAIGEVWVGMTPKALLPKGPLRLHVGSGMEHLEGWLNVDLLPLPGVDLELDVTKDLRFSRVEAIYAEHFLEHLDVLQVLDFLERAHRALAHGGVLRLTTPNLDWVWATHYRRDGDREQKVEAALALNRAFYGWEHRFLWNRETLELALTSCGFCDLEWPETGQSRHRVLRGLERHEPYPDSPELRHILIVDARKGEASPERLESLRRRLQRELLDQVKGWGAVDLRVFKETPRIPS